MESIDSFSPQKYIYFCGLAGLTEASSQTVEDLTSVKIKLLNIDIIQFSIIIMILCIICGSF